MISFRKITKKNIWNIVSLNDGNSSDSYVDYTHNILLHAIFFRKKLDYVKAIYTNKMPIGIIYFYEIFAAIISSVHLPSRTKFCITKVVVIDINRKIEIELTL